MEIKRVQTSLLNIAYLEQGATDAPVVLLIHGWPDDATTWADIIPNLVSFGYRIIAPWLRGFGETTFLSNDTPRTGNSGRLALDMIEFLDALQIDECITIGHDWGSNTAEAMAVGWPDRIKKLVQVSTPPRLGGMPTPPFPHAQLEWYHWFMATKRGVEAVRKDPIGFARIMWDNWAPEGWYSEEIFDRVSKSWLNPDFVAITIHSYRSRWDEAEPDPLTVYLEEKVKTTKSLVLPALYIQGEADGVNPPWVSEKVHEKFTGYFKRIVLTGIGHFPSREAPKKLSQSIIEFLDGEN